MASTLTADGRPYVWYDGDVWVAFYREVEVRDHLPAILAPEQVTNFGEEVARFHRATAGVARLVPPTSKTVTSDAIALYDLTASRRAADELSLDPSRIDLVRRHTHRFLMAVHESGYDYWAKQPVLIDWNLGNFSVDFSDSGRFRLFSRWDYDWFRYEARLLDFYFLSRVISHRRPFNIYLRCPHHVRTSVPAVPSGIPFGVPVEPRRGLVLKEAYRFFLLNYVVREGRFFFRHDIWQQLLHDVVDRHLPSLDSYDFSELLRELQL